MCLSKVYIENTNNEIEIEEASLIVNINGTVEVNSIFGEQKRFDGYFIKEVNFADNYIILGSRES